jgi:hypothetical protein
MSIGGKGSLNPIIMPKTDRAKLLSDYGAGYVSRTFRDYLRLVVQSMLFKISSGSMTIMV